MHDRPSGPEPARTTGFGLGASRTSRHDISRCCGCKDGKGDRVRAQTERDICIYQDLELGIDSHRVLTVEQQFNKLIAERKSKAYEVHPAALNLEPTRSRRCRYNAQLS